MKPATVNASSVSADRLRPIEGRHNALVKELRRAFDHGELTQDGYCAIEGLRIVEEAIRSGLKFGAVFFSNSAGTKAERLLPQIGNRVDTLLLPDKLFAEVVPSETPQGVAALVHPLVSTLEDLFRPAHNPSGGPHPPSFGECGDNARSLPAPLILGCAGLQDPGNFGTILRSAEAFGATGVLATEGTVSAANPKVARASAGSLFRLPVIKLTTAQALAALAENGVHLAVTSSHKGRPVHEVDLTLPTAIFIGSEGLGVPRALLDAADVAILIPHSPKVESLNAAIAASILLYEAQRQRSREP